MKWERLYTNKYSFLQFVFFLSWVVLSEQMGTSSIAIHFSSRNLHWLPERGAEGRWQILRTLSWSLQCFGKGCLREGDRKPGWPGEWRTKALLVHGSFLICPYLCMTSAGRGGASSLSSLPEEDMIFRAVSHAYWEYLSLALMKCILAFCKTI